MTDFKRVFVDTAPIIYYLENSPLYSEVIKRFFTMCIEKNIQVVTSAITVEEYLVYPYSSGKMDFVDNFKRFLNYMNVEIIDINSDIAEQASKLRGRDLKQWTHCKFHQRLRPDVICFSLMISS